MLEAEMTALVEAIRNGDYERIDSLLMHGTEIDAADEQGITPLMAAIEHNLPDAFIRTLLERGADVEARNPSGRTPLILAVEADCPNVVHLLLEAGANVHTTCTASFYDEATALHFAWQKDAVECARWLIEYGADVEAK